MRAHCNFKIYLVKRKQDNYHFRVCSYQKENRILHWILTKYHKSYSVQHVHTYALTSVLFLSGNF